MKEMKRETPHIWKPCKDTFLAHRALERLARDGKPMLPMKF